MRRVERAAELPLALASGSREAAAAFGDGSVYLEREILPARHVEVQLLADAHGTVVALGERDCSLQRRHQKLVEEAPAPGLSATQRRELHAMAIRLGAAAGLRNAATCEFLLDPDGRFWFLEVNTRLQVEHGVTELVAGVDIVREQFLVAAGLPLGDDIVAAGERASDPSGHAIEVRITAEDPSRAFAPTPGRVGRWVMPSGPGVRVDTRDRVRRPRAAGIRQPHREAAWSTAPTAMRRSIACGARSTRPRSAASRPRCRSTGSSRAARRSGRADLSTGWVDAALGRRGRAPARPSRGRCSPPGSPPRGDDSGVVGTRRRRGPSTPATHRTARRPRRRCRATAGAATDEPGWSTDGPADVAAGRVGRRDGRRRSEARAAVETPACRAGRGRRRDGARLRAGRTRGPRSARHGVRDSPTTPRVGWLSLRKDRPSSTGRPWTPPCATWAADATCSRTGSGRTRVVLEPLAADDGGLGDPRGPRRRVPVRGGGRARAAGRAPGAGDPGPGGRRRGRAAGGPGGHPGQGRGRVGRGRATGSRPASSCSSSRP